MKKLIVGLGNPGSQYANTRHNIGFIILDYLAKSQGVTFSDDRHGQVAEFKLKGKTFVLLKPNTFMNLSGKAVRYWMQQSKIEKENILVVLDDLSIDFGKLRIRMKGSDGGHNGLKSIQELIATQEYPRLRFGIGSDFAKGRQADYVLSPWKTKEEEELGFFVNRATESILCFGLEGCSIAMNKFNV
jgi:PTH1 family peptidyl-tRNA hydrolase